MDTDKTNQEIQAIRLLRSKLKNVDQLTKYKIMFYTNMISKK
jgi:hypothetical protein